MAFEWCVGGDNDRAARYTLEDHLAQQAYLTPCARSSLGYVRNQEEERFAAGGWTRAGPSKFVSARNDYTDSGREHKRRDKVESEKKKVESDRRNNTITSGKVTGCKIPGPCFLMTSKWSTK